MTNIELKELFPTEKVITDLQTIIREHGQRIEFEQGWVDVPENTKYEVITRARVEKKYDNYGFGRYRILVSLGKVNRAKDGILVASLGFALLYYAENKELMTYDISPTML